MSYLKDNLKQILEDYAKSAEFFNWNKKLYNIIRGDLLTSMYEEFDKLSSPTAKKDAKDKAVALNFYEIIVNHKSQLYTMPVSRVANFHQDEVDKLIKNLAIDKHFHNGTRYYNASKSAAIEIYEKENMDLGIRPVHNGAFSAWTDSPVEPNIPKVIIKNVKTISKKKKDSDELYSVDLLIIYSDTEILAVDTDGDEYPDMLPGDENSKGVNGWGVLPFIYVNQDNYELLPMISKDNYQNIIMFNCIMTFANVAMFYQGNPVRILSNVDIKKSQISINPNDLIVLNSLNSELEAKLTELATTMDPTKATHLANEIINRVLQINDISLADGSAAPAQSGVALSLKQGGMVENRKNQIEQWRPAEEDFWLKYAKIHNRQKDLGRIGPNMITTLTFDDKFSVEVDFPLPDTSAEQIAGRQDEMEVDEANTVETNGSIDDVTGEDNSSDDTSDKSDDTKPKLAVVKEPVVSDKPITDNKDVVKTPEVEPTAKPVVPTVVAPAEVIALNGAQISSLLEITNMVSRDELPKDSAKALIAAALPMLTPQQVNDIIDPIIPSKPAKVE